MPHDHRLADPTNYGNAPGSGGPLRVGGKSKGSVPAVVRDADLPSTPSECVKRQTTALAIVRDLWGGTERMRDRGTVYLPKAEAEPPDTYRIRLGTAVLFNAFRRTVSGLTGFVFSKDPVLGEDVPPQIREHYENIDNAGTHGDVFLREQLQDALQTGHNAILVEFPQTDGTQNARQELSGEVRPYWVPIKKDNIVSWRTLSENGRPILTQLVVKESTMAPTGAFGEEPVERYRVFYRTPEGVVGYRLLRIIEGASGKGMVEESAGTYRTQDEIPVAEVTTSGKRGMFESDPPLIDLAFLNIAHYQERSDYAYSKHMTCVPILGLFGFADSDEQGRPIKVVVAPNAALRTSNHEADAKYITHDGASLAEVRTSLEELKSEMGALGIAMLAPQKRTAETAEAKRIDKQTTDSDLAVAARGLQDGVERALYFHARYLRLDDGGSVEINRNFEAGLMEPDVMAAYVALARDLGLPLRIVLDELKKGGRIGSDVDLDELEQEMVREAAAREAVQKFEAEQDARRIGAVDIEYDQSTGRPTRLAPSAPSSSHPSRTARRNMTDVGSQ